MSEQVTNKPRRYEKHGLNRLKKAVRVLGSRAIDRRTEVGRALMQWRGELVADLGGADSISTQRAALIELAIKDKLLLDSIDAWLFARLAARGTLVNTKTRSMIPVVKERLSLASHLVQVLKELGLERKTREVVNLGDYLKNRAATQPVAVKA